MKNMIKKFKEVFSEITKTRGLSVAIITGIILVPIILVVVGILLGAIGTIFAGLWNLVIPEVFTGVGPLTWIQGIIIIVLLKIICGE